MTIVPYTSSNNASTEIAFRRHSQSGDGDGTGTGTGAGNAVLGVTGIVDSAGNEVGASNPLPVMFPSSRVFSSDLTLDTSAYAVGDTLASILEITNATLGSAGTGTIQSITIIDKDNQRQPLDLVFFDRSVTVGTSNAAWAVSDSDLANALGIVKIEGADYTELNGNAIATVTPPPIGIQPSSGTSIYLGTVSQGTGTYAANGLAVVITIARDN